MQRSDFRFACPLRVRWAEIDAQNIVFNAHYLMYLDTAVMAYWRAMAVPYATTLAALNGDLFVRKASLEYHGSARLDERIDVALRCARVGNSSMQFEGGVFRQDTLLVGAELIYVFADPVATVPRPVPGPLRDALAAFEAGEPMTTLRVGPWSEVGASARDLRTRVFVQEQGIAPELEWDEADETAMHAVVVNRLGTAVATGRLIKHGPGVARIGRMAVRSELRSEGLGRQVLDALVNAARQRGDRHAILHAQCSAADFYSLAGFVAEGERFEEAGIAHIQMRRAL